MIKDIICISCPIGCHLKVDTDKKTVTGNTCKRGESYGINEAFNPVRIVTSTVKLKGSNFVMLPVKTEKPVPKELNFKVMKEINKVVASAPIKVGDVIIPNVLGTGVDVIATKSASKN